jgi:light-regulated signal transduction histidine kinase (bacteriophytochrome)
MQNTLQDIFQEFQEQLENLTLSQEEKTQLQKSFEKVQKTHTRLEFLHRRGMKDKAITINILENTVEQLQKQKDYIERTNEQLTHQKIKLEEQSQMMAKNLHALQLSYNELEQFAFVASHDLKSPLRNIGSYAQLLKKRYYNQMDEDANVYLDFITNNAQLMNTIINDILEYNNVNNDKETTLADFEKLMIVVKNNLRESITHNNAVINYSSLPAIWVQKGSILKLLNHLIDNAIKNRTDVNPVIDIAAQKIEDGNIWHFTVKDNGIGLDEAYNDKVFKLFQRIHNREQAGTGMGLAICSKVVKLHGGDIWFTKNREGGTTFHFTIPQING